MIASFEKDAAIILAVFLGVALLVGPHPKQAVRLFDKEITVDRHLYATIVGLLEDGQYAKEDLSIDASQTQTISIVDGRMRFNPPIEVKWKFLKTTVTDISVNAKDNSIFIDVDHSPVDVKVVPK